MNELATLQCQPQPKGTAPLANADIIELQQQIRYWRLSSDQKFLQREFKFKDYLQTISFVNAVAWIAEQQDHHPEIQIRYHHCSINFTTHSINGLSMNDFICAARINKLHDST